jgi:hypothetical protein
MCAFAQGSPEAGTPLSAGSAMPFKKADAFTSEDGD